MKIVKKIVPSNQCQSKNKKSKICIEITYFNIKPLYGALARSGYTLSH